jgi:pimeloyl-ACP methyl ester carboxylesterase
MSATTESSAGAAAIRPFTIPVTPEAEIEALRAQVAATRWPDQELVTDHSQGPQLAVMQELARYWAAEYDWRRCEAKLSALPHFITEIDGLDIHFIHVRSQHENTLPVIITHGWPGSIIEMLEIIGPLTDPTAHGGSAADAFHVVVPSIPGYGYSGKPRETGWGPTRIAQAWTELMKRLGYTQFVAQGGDWGAIITDVMAAQAPPELLGMHTNMPGVVAAAVAGHPVGNLTRDEVLDNVTLYWLTNTAISSARLYWENTFDFFGVHNVSIPAAVTVFPNEIYKAPRSWAERAYPKLIYFNEVDRGCHFAAWQEPALFSSELRAAFRSLR